MKKVEFLKKIFKKENLFSVLNLCTAAAMVFVTWSMYRANNTQVNIAKNIETRKFCDEFNNWFWETNYKLKMNPSTGVDIDLFYLYQWLGLEGYEIPDSITNNWNYIEKQEHLANSYALNKLLNFFETAKQMHKSEPALLDVDHFKNAFVSTAFRLERTKKPNADTVILYIRDKNNNSKIFDGYRYCTDIILYKRMKAKFGDDYIKKRRGREIFKNE
ncbi:MAG: hypothetical protein LBJ63_10000 [Prevotellaceae bacterium]|nr:hypothetical protein [Prevotellaceae bacterium]